MQHPGTVGVIPGVAVDRLAGDRHNPSVSLVAVERPVSTTAVVEVAGQGEVLIAVLVLAVIIVEVGVHGTALNWKSLRFGDVGQAAHINFSEINGFVPDDRRRWWWSGAIFISFRILFEEITYN